MHGNVHRAHREMTTSLGPRQLGVHATRHTFASLSLAANLDAAWISRQLGHFSVAFTLDTYAHFILKRRDLSALDFGSDKTTEVRHR